jgi:hypothetical protein
MGYRYGIGIPFGESDWHRSQPNSTTVVGLRLCLSIDGLRARSRVQPNVLFEVDDAEREWTWPVVRIRLPGYNCSF